MAAARALAGNALDPVLDVAAVRVVRRLHQALRVAGQGLADDVGHVEPLLLRQHQLRQLRGRGGVEVGKLDDLGDSRLQAGVHVVQHLAHRLVVARENHDHLPFELFLGHHRHDLVRRFLEVRVPARVPQSVRFVDEQHGAARRLEDLPRLARGLADVTGREVRRRAHFHFRRRQDAQGLKENAHLLRDRRLAGARRPDERERQRQVLQRVAADVSRGVHDHPIISKALLDEVAADQAVEE
mmetsp:Transcript_12033/g.36233  ORF Transcript_12033/g.36233 Transcript_12033/m.36233 type:complete len:241 (-) Transcript_12033:2678-3400(-)